LSKFSKYVVIARPEGTEATFGQRGFTFIEVMVAMLIFVLAVLAAVNIARGSVRATIDAKEMTVASWLVQNAMVDLETRLETEGIEKGCEKKKEGKFPPPHENFSWISSCEEIEFNISEEASKLQAAAGQEEDTSQQANVIQKMILQTASEYITKALRELHTEVYWMRGKQRLSVDLTTHFVRYDLPLVLSATGGPGGAGAPPSGGQAP